MSERCPPRGCPDAVNRAAADWVVGTNVTSYSLVPTTPPRNRVSKVLSEWIAAIGLDPRSFGTHSLRRTKAALIYRRTGNLRAVQLLLGHTKVQSTVRYPGIEVDDALALAEKVDI